MAGQITPIIRLGRSRQENYDFYPYISFKVIGEDGRAALITPSYNELFSMLISCRQHELKVDITRDRRPYTSKLIKGLKDLIPALEKMSLTEFDEIENIYYIPRKKED